MPEKGDRETQLSLISSQRRLATKGSEKKSALIGNIGRDLNLMSRIEYLQFSLADKMLHYGVLLILFGLSVVIGFVICSHFFPK